MGEWVNLPESEWYICTACGGKKTYLMQGDAHKSTGWVPCYHCNKDGLRTTKYVETEEEIQKRKDDKERFRLIFGDDWFKKRGR